MLGEEVDSKIAVLTSLSRGGDTDDLTGTTLEDQQIANTDVMAGNGDGIGHQATTLNIANSLMDSVTDTTRASLSIFLLNYYLLALMLWMERVKYTLSSVLKAATDGVVPPFVVVVTHAWTMWLIYGCLDFNSFLSRSGMTTLVFYVVIGLKAASVIAFSNVDLFFAAMVVVGYFDVDLCISITAV